MPDAQRVWAWLRAVGARLSARGQAVVRRLASGGADENTVLLGFGLAIGAVVGVSVVVIYRLIDLIHAGALTTTGRFTGIGSLSIFLVVLAGLAGARALVRYGTGDSDGENVADVMRAVAKRGGVIHALPVGIKTAGAALVIGTGGSVGAEGPIAVAGSALGSRIGRFFRSGPARLKVLVACGAASGISAAFNAPIAGVFFSLEKVLGQFGINSFPPVLVSSVVAATISRAAFGNSPVIAIPALYGVGSASELVFYALLGIATGLVGVLYTRGVFRATDLLARFPRPRTQVLAAGVVVAGLGMAFRTDLWGRGHETLTLSLVGERAGWFLVALALAKLVVTAFTLAAARAGGVFTPALFIGATLGGGLGVLSRDVLPGFGIVPEAFALVGMAGLIAGSTHAPLTAVMIVFEMTSDYALILPLMLCGAIAYITARRLHPHSIYSEWLVRHGEHITAGQDTAALERLKVQECYNRSPHVIADTATVRQIVQAIGAARQTEFPVLDGDHQLVGMITYDDLRTVIAQQDTLAPVVVASDLASAEFERVTPEDSLRTALQRLAVRGTHSLPVVDGDNPNRLLGLVTRQDIHTTYDRALLQQ
jgi:CIC family chloride channel protein